MIEAAVSKRSPKPVLNETGTTNAPEIQDTFEGIVRDLLLAIGEDPDREGLKETPRRVRSMLTDLTRGLNRDPADELSVEFHESYHGVVLVRDISFYSLCEHHLLPFFGTVHIAYQPDRGVLTGLSKLARLVETASRRPQVQERLTKEIADALERRLHPQGVLVWISAEHLCMAMRGVEKVGAKTLTLEATGTLQVGQPAHHTLVMQLGAIGGNP